MNAEDFIKAWDAGQDEFTILSSGSTGPSKPVVLQRKWMIWSAENSGKIIHHSSDDKLLCCLPADKVGGMMLLVRAKVWGLPFEIREPSSNPLLNDCDCSIISLTPFQLDNILRDESSATRLAQFSEVLIGGAPINRNLEDTLMNFNDKTTFRHSYGMSETYSHVAIRTLNGAEKTSGFVCMDHVRIDRNDQGCAIIIAPFCREGLTTNDIIEFQSDGSFTVIGRSDFVINTGAVKISPEAIEDMIERNLKPDFKFIISSITDEKLGEKIVLVIEGSGKLVDQDWNFIKSKYPYSAPKEIINIDKLPYNSGGKPDRLKIKNWLNGKN